MTRTLGWSAILIRSLNRFRRPHPGRPFSTEKKSSSATTSNNGAHNGEINEGSSLSKYDAYRELDNLNFMTASKILFSEPRKKKKFGIDFHLVQFFFACMPSLAVYLVAQYARYEMRKMDAELELKKQAEEAAKAKEMELEAAEDKKEVIPNQNLLEVKERLEKLEETVKEIVGESKKQSGNTITKNQEDSTDKKLPPRTEQSNTQSGPKGNDSVDGSDDSIMASNRRKPASDEATMRGSAPVGKVSQKDQMGAQDGGPCTDAKK